MRFKNFESYANESREMKRPADVLLISDLSEKAGKKLFVVG